MRFITNWIALFLFVLWAAPGWTQSSQIESLRIWSGSPDRTRVVFDVTSPAPYRVFTLKDPHRLVVDLSNTRLNTRLPQFPPDHPIFRKIRSTARQNADVRVVLDLKLPVKPKSFQLKPDKPYGHRLVIDIYPNYLRTVATTPTVAKTPKKKRTASTAIRQLIIAIDAGHGGEDPGALGRRGTREKDVVLTIAKQLAVLIRKESGMRPVLIRKGDYYLGLRQRIKLARNAKADLFVSIHADAFKNSGVQGASVFTLSQRGASSEAAKWLAAKENAADLIGGIKLGDKDNVLAKVLMDLSQTATMEASYDVGKRVLINLKDMGQVHKNVVQKARFVVLKSPDIPSILVETAFISNPIEEKKLRNPRYQRRLARAVFTGIREYFALNPPPGTHFSAKRHVISKGETLSGIAQHYGVSTKRLRAVNALSQSHIQIGQVLTIPTGT